MASELPEQSEETVESSVVRITHLWPLTKLPNPGRGSAATVLSSVFPLRSTLQWQLELKVQASSLQYGYGGFALGGTPQGSLDSCKLTLKLVSGANKVEILYHVNVESHIPKGKVNTTTVGVAYVTVTQENPIKLDVSRSILTSGSKPLLTLDLVVLRNYPVVEVPPNSDLITDLKSTLEARSELNDVTLFAGPQKEEIKTNKFMLMARSPVFTRMFQSGMKEQNTNQVKLPDESVEVCREMLTYIHTDQAPNIRNMAEDLWKAANKYELADLQARCENYLAGQLTVDTVAHILTFADMYCGLGDLREHAMAFITNTQQRCRDVMASEGWSEVESRPDLRYEVVCRSLGVPPQTKKARIID